MSDTDFGVVLPQVGVGWDEALTFARRAEEIGFDSVWVIDHVLGFPPQSGILEAWTMMSALAVATSSVGIGAQVLCQSFRPPGLLAKMSTTLDLISGGRLRFLIGAGWFQAEYDAFGLPFPPGPRRVTELEDTIRICRGMFDAGSEPFSYSGKVHSVTDLVNVPAPARRIPIGVGGAGDRMMDLTARLADEWNSPALMLGNLAERIQRLDDRMARAGREPSEVKRSAQIVFHPGSGEVPPAMQFFNPALGLTGSRDQMVDRVGELGQLGVTGLYGVVADLAHLDAMGEVLADLRKA